MNLVEKAGLALLHKCDPERAHTLSLLALRAGAVPLPGPLTSDRLTTELCGMTLANPVGLAAGYDKNAVAVDALGRSGFGFVEVGAATPRPQPGNPKPRLFRLSEDRAAINRFGFNNEGMEAIARRLAVRRTTCPVGLNLGANKDSPDRAADYVKVLNHCGPHCDFVTINVSSPNTEKLRDLQGKAALTSLVAGVIRARNELPEALPVFLKIAPDLTDAEIAEIAEVAVDQQLDAVIATNTTLSREGLISPHANQAGGLSGRPLFEKSTRVLARLSFELDGKIPLIGVGGVSSADDAYAKIRAGASAVQLYTALVFQGFSLVQDVVQGLDALLERDGFKNVAEAVGTKRGDWL